MSTENGNLGREFAAQSMIKVSELIPENLNPLAYVMLRVMQRILCVFVYNIASTRCSACSMFL